MALTEGTRIECVDCDGQHTGTVVHVFGLFYGVAWDDRNREWGKPGNTAPQFPAHFIAQHRAHIASVGDLAVRPV